MSATRAALKSPNQILSPVSRLKIDHRILSRNQRLQRDSATAAHGKPEGRDGCEAGRAGHCAVIIRKNIHKVIRFRDYSSKLHGVAESARGSKSPVFIGVFALSATCCIGWYTAWEAGVLPLNYSRSTSLDYHRVPFKNNLLTDWGPLSRGRPILKSRTVRF